MELHLRRQHPTSLGTPGGCWGFLERQAAAQRAGAVEIRLFGDASWHGADAWGEPGRHILRVPQPLDEFPLWLKRDARRREASCLYVLVAELPDLRSEARSLGLSVLDFADLDRRLGLAAASAVVLEEVRKAPKPPSILKGGKTMSAAELRWWSEQLDLPAGEPAEDPAAARREREARLDQLLGADPDDPRVLRHDEEQWLASNFPPDELDHRPRRPDKTRRR